MSTPGKRLKMLRGKRKQSEIEEATGIKYYLQSNYENDTYPIPTPTLEIYCKYYNVSSDFILFGEDIKGQKCIELKDILTYNDIKLEGVIMTDKEKQILLKLSESILLIRE